MVMLGRVRNARVVRDRVLADLHMGRYAGKNSQGDLRHTYLLRVLEDRKDAIDAELFLQRERARLTRWA